MNYVVNPKTGRRIAADGDTAKKLKRAGILLIPWSEQIAVPAAPHIPVQRPKVVYRPPQPNTVIGEPKIPEARPPPTPEQQAVIGPVCASPNPAQQISREDGVRAIKKLLLSQDFADFELSLDRLALAATIIAKKMGRLE